MVVQTVCSGEGLLDFCVRLVSILEGMLLKDSMQATWNIIEICHNRTFQNIRVQVRCTKISSGLGGIPNWWKMAVSIDQQSFTLAVGEEPSKAVQRLAGMSCGWMSQQRSEGK